MKTIKRHKILGSFLILAVLVAPGAQALTISANPGAVGFPVFPSITLFVTETTSVLDVVWDDMKYLEFGPGNVSVELSSANVPDFPFTGYLTDESSAKIPGTDFAGNTFDTPGVVTLAEFTIWHDIHFEGNFQLPLPEGQDGWAWGLSFGDFTQEAVPTVGAVPIPAAVWLFGSAVGLLGWMRRKAA